VNWLLINASWVCVPVLAGVAVAAVIKDRRAVRDLLRVRRSELLLLAGVVLFAWGLRQFYVFHTHNAYFDEFDHMEMAGHLLKTGQFGM